MVDPGRFISGSVVTGCLLMAAVAAYAALSYSALPDEVAIDFGPDGRPVIGPKERLLTPLAVLVGVGLGAVALASVMAVYRHAIVERYPYLINLPALALILGRLDEERKRHYIDRVFMLLALLPLFVAAVIGIITASILEAARSMTFEGTVLMASVLSPTAAFIAGSLFYYRSIYKKIRAEVI